MQMLTLEPYQCNNNTTI